MSIGVAMAHGKQDSGIVGINNTVMVLIEDIVIEGIDHFARGDATCVIPVEMVIDWSELHTGRKGIVATTQQRELCLRQRRFLALERIKRRGDVSVCSVSCADTDGWVGGVGESVVGDQAVEVAEVAGGQEQRIVSRTVIVASVDAERLSAMQKALVNFDETSIRNCAGVERDISFPTVARLTDDAGGGVNGIIEKIADALVEGIDAGQDAFDVAFGKDGRS